MGMEDRTYRISFDDGVISGSCNPGWLIEDSGDWQPIDAPYGPLPGFVVPEWSADGTTHEEQIAQAIRDVHSGARVLLVGDGWVRELAGS